jgi:hypothetical protein
MLPRRIYACYPVRSCPATAHHFLPYSPPYLKTTFAGVSAPLPGSPHAACGCGPLTILLGIGLGWGVVQCLGPGLSLGTVGIGVVLVACGLLWFSTPLVYATPERDRAELFSGLLVDSWAWFVWLRSPFSRRFLFCEYHPDHWEPETGLCLVQKEHRAGQTAWYASRQSAHARRWISLGPSANVTLAALWAAADLLIKVELREEHALTRQD